ncbi:MAG: glycosyltransferase [Marinirhabdus sp.]|nr:glycosyltransferase [Marinirhabdus sp.]
MKILHVINSLSAGGAEKLVSELATAQAEDEEVSLFSFSNDHDIFQEKIGKRVRFFPHYGAGYLSLKTWKELSRLIKQNDIIHTHLFPSFYIVAILSILHQKKTFVYTEHNTYNKRRKCVFYPIERWVYSRYAAVVAISKGVKIALEKWIGEKKNVKIINNFIDLDAIAATQFSTILPSINSNSIKLVMVGSFSEQKDQETLLRTMAILPSQYELILIGDGPKRKRLTDLASELQVSDRVHFLGIRKDVIAILKGCEYGILSSHWEGFGIVALEYMAAGLITLGSDVSGLNEVVPIAKNLFTVGDFEFLAKRIQSIQNDDEMYKEIMATQNLAIKNYDISTAKARHLKFYRTLLKIK